MTVHWGVLLAVWSGTACALGFCASVALVEMMGRAWRRSVGVHWSERARLAFAPGAAVLWLAAAFPAFGMLVIDLGLDAIAPGQRPRWAGLGMSWAAIFGGVMAARYVWLRELWGTRVTLRSWLGGCLTLLIVLMPGPVISLLLLFILPETFSARAACTFGAAVLAVGFLGAGGGILLLRLMGTIKPAPVALEQMVQQLAAQMNVQRPIKVFVLEWAQVNAVAWQVYRAIGFSRALLTVMDAAETRAVAAHELAHLLEPTWARQVRVANWFALLPMAVLAKYAGPWAPLLAGGWGIGVIFGYMRFSRRFERQADHAEHDAIADPETYMRTLLKLHEANMTPAVMLARQTHPHLYDRLLAGGIQPNFPRPLPPSRKKPLFAAIVTTAILSMLMVAMVILSGAFLKRAGFKLGPPAEQRGN